MALAEVQQVGQFIIGTGRGNAVMGAQDNTERVLRSLYVLISKSEIYEHDEDKIVIDRDRITSLLSNLKECIYDMMDEYEMTKESRDHAEREFRKQADEIVLDASHKAEDVYAASVMYTDEALGNVQRIMAEAEESVKKVYEEMQKKLVEERHTVQSNQTDLQSQLQDLTDTDKYLKLINERNKEIRKEKEKEQRLALRQRKENRYADRQTGIRVDQEAIRRLGLASEDEEEDANTDAESEGTSDSKEKQAASSDEASIYADRQTEVRVDQEVLRKLRLAKQQSQADSAQEDRSQETSEEQKPQARVQQQADAEDKSPARTQQEDAEQDDSDLQAVAQDWDEAVLRQQMMERARELERRKARVGQRRGNKQQNLPGDIDLIDLNPFSDEDPAAQELEDELIRLDLDDDYFKWKDEQDARINASAAKSKTKRRLKK